MKNHPHWMRKYVDKYVKRKHNILVAFAFVVSYVQGQCATVDIGAVTE